MTIYTRHGAPVEIIAARQCPRWYVRTNGGASVYDKEPTPAQTKGATELSRFDIWWITAKITGPYPDGSGRVGETLDEREQNDFIADNGAAEIDAACIAKLKPD